MSGGRARGSATQERTPRVQPEREADPPRDEDTLLFLVTPLAPPFDPLFTMYLPSVA